MMMVVQSARASRRVQGVVGTYSHREMTQRVAGRGTIHEKICSSQHSHTCKMIQARELRIPLICSHLFTHTYHQSLGGGGGGHHHHTS